MSDARGAASWDAERARRAEHWRDYQPTVSYAKQLAEDVLALLAECGRLREQLDAQRTALKEITRTPYRDWHLNARIARAALAVDTASCGTCGHGPCVGGGATGEGTCPKWTPPRAALGVEGEPAEKEVRDVDDVALGGLLYDAWAVIANVSEGDWTKQPQEWQDAATRWRDAWHKTLDGAGEQEPGS